MRKIIVKRLDQLPGALYHPSHLDIGSSPFDNQPGFDPTENRWVAIGDADNHLLGTADIWRSPGSDYAEIDLNVPTAADASASVVKRLLEHSVAHARRKSSLAVLTYLEAKDHYLSQTLEHLGFKQANGYRLRSRTHTSADTLRFSPGLTLTTYAEVRDKSFLAEALEKSYNGRWGHKFPNPELLEVVLNAFPHDAIFLLLDESSRPAGNCNATQLPAGNEEQSPSGYIDAPGVVTPHRTLDNYTALVKAATNWHIEKGSEEILMDSWGDPPELLAAYSELGFELEEETPGYVLEL